MTRELDAEVAEKVMGWKRPTRGSVTWYRSDGTGTSDAPEYSSSIGLAFQVVEKMRERGYEFGLSGFFMAEKRWLAEFWKDDMSRKEEFYTTAPEAICRAALSALTTLKEQGHAGRIGEEK